MEAYPVANFPLNKWFSILLITAGTCLLFSCHKTARPDNKSRLETNSDITQPAYQSLLDKADTYSKSSGDVTVISYGQTVKGLPLKLIRVQRASSSSNSGSKRPAVLITEATHGNEFLDVGNQVLDWVATDKGTSKGLATYLEKGGAIFFVPAVNPDGYEYHRLTPENQKQADGGPDQGNTWGRMNANRVDLNRDYPTPKMNFAGLTQPETTQLVAIVKKEIVANFKLEVDMEYHCCIDEGALLMSYAYSQQARVPQADQQRFNHLGELFRRQLPQAQVGTAIEVAGYAARGTTMDYYFDTYQTLAVTYEGKYRTEGSRFEAHRLFWDSMLADIATRYDGGSVIPLDSTPATDASIRVAIVTEDAAGVSFAVAHDTATRARICASTLENCLKASDGFLDLASQSQASGRQIMMNKGSQSKLSTTATDYVVITLGANGQPQGFLKFQLKHK